MISSNNFSKDQPTKSGNTFVEDKPAKSTNTFTEDMPAQSYEVFDGENVTDAPLGGDFATFGNTIATEPFGGRAHFLNRTPNTPTH